jgi:multidrug efflux system membrane fusion protein
MNDTHTASPASAHRHRWLAAAVCVIVAGLVFWHFHAAAPSAAPRPATVPVTASATMRRDMPVWIDGIGTVQPLNVVNVMSRVDGQLDRVAFTEGQMVKAGDLLAEVDPRPFQAALDQAQATTRKDAAQHANALLDLERYRTLSSLQVVPRQQLDTQKAQADSLLATVAADQSAAENARLQLSYTRISAPLSGRVGQRLVDQGSQVHASDTTGLVTITQIEPITVAFSVPQDALPDLVAAQKAAALKVLATSRDGSTALATGTLVFIDSQVAAGTGQILLKAQFDNADHALWPGAFVAARLLLRTDRAALVVPSGALQSDQQGSYVYVIDAAQSVQIRRVTPGVSDAQYTEISQGLADGERIVVDGQANLSPGSHVVAKPYPTGPEQAAPGKAGAQNS